MGKTVETGRDLSVHKNMDKIIVKGAREHNLQNVSVELPKNKLVVITGVSGSGKSSLAFDTIYAEGQRRYVESLSTYARQFLGIMDKPDVDSIEGLSPAISIDQKSSSHNPRSTVGTITEIYDYLRLLFARIGHPHCPKCSQEIKRMSLDEIIEKVRIQILNHCQTEKIKPQKFIIYSPIVRQKKGEFKELFINLKSKGYTTVRVDNKIFNIDDDISLIKTNKHSIDVMIDQLTASYSQIKDKIFVANLISRLRPVVEQSLSLSDGLVVLSKSNSKDILFSEKFSCPKCNLSLPEIEPRMFSFNFPLGACEKCKGLGTIYRIDPDLVINKNISINEGGIIPYEKMFFSDSWHARIFKQMCEEEKIDLNKKISDLSKDKIKLLLYGSSKTYQVTGTNRFGKITGIVDSYFGVIKELERRFFESVGQLEEIEVNRYVREDVCPVCDGKRLKPEILAITIDEKNIVEVGEGSIKSFYQYFNEELNNKLSDYEISVAKLIIKEIKTRLLFLINVGLSYLTINRPAKTLSGGELQRIRLASQIGSGLTGVLYVLDEPSIGLHPKDVNALINTLIKLRDLGNSIVVVEHDKETIMKSDYSIELGPMAGRHGGRIIFSGTVNAMLKEKKSLTGRYLNGLKKIKMPTRELVTTRGFLDLKNCTQNNLKKISVRFPLGNLICVTGVSGSGKSTLLTETLYPALKYYLDGHYQETMGKFSQFLGYQYVDRVYLVDQGPIGRTPRSNPATYIGFFDEIRALYSETIEAKAKGFKKGRFSFNVKGGRCEKCQGAGLIRIQMQFLPDVYVKCDVCNGQRYNQETLEITYRDKNIYDVLKMTVDEATIFFQNHFFIYQKLVFLQNVGLGYIELGQAAPTFSGGEAQRIKLANELSRRDSGKTVYILDEPTTGLHFYDIEKLLHTLYQLVEKGNTVILIEHNVDVIKNSQYVIDLGPGPGDEGGNVVYQGELEGLRKNKKSYTAEYL